MCFCGYSLQSRRPALPGCWVWRQQPPQTTCASSPDVLGVAGSVVVGRAAERAAELVVLVVGLVVVLVVALVAAGGLALRQPKRSW